jgi:hypothetical protein
MDNEWGEGTEELDVMLFGSEGGRGKYSGMNENLSLSEFIDRIKIFLWSEISNIA